MKRRDFIKSSLTVSALAGAASAALTAAPAAKGQEYYELRAYRFKAGADHTLLDNFLEKAAIPGLNRLGFRPIGVFTEMEIKDNTPTVYVLIPYPSLEAFGTAWARLNADPEYQAAGKEYLQTPKANPGFLRIDSWLLLAFAGMPKLELPAYCKEKKPRIFEMRTYESHSELKALNKVEMFNAGEIDAMHEVKLGPIFYGQTLIGNGLPHLIYMLSAEDRETHKQHFADFGKHPTWQKLKADPQYAGNTSKTGGIFLVPTAFSQI
jgi:hypothetical protein